MMNVALIVALTVAVPIILFPSAFVWYLNIGGITQAIKDAIRVRAAKKAEVAGRIT